MGPKYNPVYEEDKMKIIRLLYPDYISGGLDTYYFGAKLLQHILPQNENQPLIEVDIFSRTAAIDLYYRQIILNQGIPFSLTIPKSLPARDAMDEKAFHGMMARDYDQAIRGDTYPVEDVFEELEKGL